MSRHCFDLTAIRVRVRYFPLTLNLENYRLDYYNLRLLVVSGTLVFIIFFLRVLCTLSKGQDILRRLFFLFLYGILCIIYFYMLRLPRLPAKGRNTRK